MISGSGCRICIYPKCGAQIGDPFMCIARIFIKLTMTYDTRVFELNSDQLYNISKVEKF